MKRLYTFRHFGQTVTLGAVLFFSGVAQSAPGNLPVAPLLLTDAVEPNFYFTLDDSGSMEWELMTPASTGLSLYQGLPTLAGLTRYYMLPNKANGHDGGYSSDYYPYTVPSASADPLTWIARNHIGNSLYYDPEVTYQPWPGGAYSAVTDATEVLIDPTNASLGTIDLTKDISYHGYKNGHWFSDTIFPATYYVWKDSNSNGILETTDSATEIKIEPSTTTYPSGRTYAKEILNFATWYQYHRKRSFVAKAAFGLVINSTDATRIGLDIFNGGHRLDALSMSDPASKSTLFNTLYTTGIYCGTGKDSIYPNRCNGTPARKALDNVGKLFKGETSDPSPILSADKGGECQQNFNVLMSDGYWNGSDPSGIGNADGDNNTDFDGGSYADSYSPTLADVAMHYYEDDLNGILANNVPIEDGVDEATHQHLVTYTIGFGVKGNLDPAVDNPLTDGPNFWTNPIDAQDEDRIDDLWHAAYNSRGKYLNAQSPKELEASLLSAIMDMNDRTATTTAVAVNSARLTAESVVYIAQFDSNRWQGELRAYSITDLSLGTLSSSPKWTAGKQLDDQDPKTRVMLTYDGSKGVPFQWDASVLSTAMVNDLRTNSAGRAVSDDTAKARLEFLRGDRSNEAAGEMFRSRPKLLGDIVNSGPVFVGKPVLSWPDTDPFPHTSGSLYSDFVESNKSRNKTVYVGSNDGMLHAFNDANGKEILAYLPNILASTSTSKGYHYLTEPDYSHNWYVDLTPTVSDTYITTHAGSGWRTVLIGGLRGGGRGLFALDITDPSDTSFTEANANKIAMWEFDNSIDNDLGYTYSRPNIALANNGRWVAIFGNGYNDLGSGEASLFIVDIEKGIDGWTAGDFIKITTKAGTTSDRNGLAEPVLADTDGNGTVDRAYAGDLKGNLWAFDLSSTSASNWNVAFKSGSTPIPLFKTGTNQPITAKPVLTKHPTIPFSSSPSNAPNFMVFFGTGQYLVNSDKTDTSTQSYYGVWDKGDATIDQTDLIEQTMTTFTSGEKTYRNITNNFVDYSTDYGWWFNLSTSGERNVTNSIARSNTVFFNSFVPENDPCAVGGYGFEYAVNMATGGSPSEPVVDYNGDGVVNEDDNIGGHVNAAVKTNGYLPQPVFVEDLKFSGATTARKVIPLTDLPSGRFSWQELIK